MGNKVILLAALLIVISGPAASPAGEVNISVFYDQMAPYGEWIRIAPYGWCWQPHDMPVDWRPYSTGHWLYTEDGPIWVADENWGWIPFHYGRWDYDDFYGWIWVPGAVWAPSWCAWRYGDGYVGWAPLPPGVGFSFSTGLTWGPFGIDDIDDHHWCFVPEREFFDHDIDRVILYPGRNVSIIRFTRNVTNIIIINRRVVNRGFSEDMVDRWAGRRVPRYRIRDDDRVHWPEIRGDEVFIHRPVIAPRPPSHEPPKVLPPERRLAPTERRMLEPPEWPMGPVERPREQKGAPATPMERRMEQRPAIHSLGPPPPFEQERQLLQRRHENQTRQMQTFHQKELENPPPGVTRQELMQRQGIETRSMQEEQRRERSQLQRRYYQKPMNPWEE